MNKIPLILLAAIFAASIARGQEKSSTDSLQNVDSVLVDDLSSNNAIFEFNNLRASFEDGLLNVKTSTDSSIYSRAFNDPVLYAQDLNADSADEFIVVDYQQNGKNYVYNMYIYKIFDEFSLVDSLYSGLVEPYFEINSELNKTILVAGDPEFDFLNNPDSDETYSPMRCYAFEDDFIVSVDDELYDIYIKNNDEIISFLDEFYQTNGKIPANTEKVKAAIAEVYINYLSAQEKALAQKFIDSYYFSADKESFIIQLNKLNEE